MNEKKEKKEKLLREMMVKIKFRRRRKKELQ